MLQRLGIILTLLLLTGCTASHLATHPDAYLDPLTEQEGLQQASLVVMGGEIATLSHEGGGTRVELNRLTLTDRAYPMIHQPIDGAKVVLLIPNRRLGGELYRLGNYLSAVGEVVEVTEQSIGGKHYQITTLLVEDPQAIAAWYANERRFEPLYRDDGYNAIRRGGYYGRGGFGIGIGL